MGSKNHQTIRQRFNYWMSAGIENSEIGFTHFRTRTQKTSGIHPGARGLFALLPLTSQKGKSGLGLLAISVFTMATSVFTFSFLFSQTAYAGSNISVSSSGTVSFGKVLPSSTGTTVTGEDTLSIDTDCSAGANVYATSINGGSTSLINQAAKAQDENANSGVSTDPASYTINTSSSAIGSASVLANNTWGLNTINNNTYYGLPAYSTTSLPTAIYTGTNSTVPVYYGAKITSSLAPGTYTGQVLYTVTVNSACLTYTVNFDKNANDATGTMDPQEILVSASTPLSKNNFTRSGYSFLGWNTDPAATTALYTDEESVSSLAPAEGSITLYAIWKRNDITYKITFANSNSATGNIPADLTYTGPEISHTFTLPSATPTINSSYTPLTTFANYNTSAGSTGTNYNPGATVTLTSSSPTKTLYLTWNRSCTISTTTACTLADGKTWIIGYNDQTITWNNMFTDATGAYGHDATVNASYNGTTICPSGYYAPKKSDYVTLRTAYGDGTSSTSKTGRLYQVLGLSNGRFYWASTEGTSTSACGLGVNTTYSSPNDRTKASTNRVLCYK